MIRQKYEGITEVNYRADTKRFIHRRCKKLTSGQSLDDAKNNMSKNPSVNSANNMLLKVPASVRVTTYTDQLINT